MPDALTLRRRLALAVLVVTALASAGGCRGAATAPSPVHPLVLVGVDGLEWRLVIEMAGAGRLPELSRLMQQGSFARLATLSPTISPPIWTSMATGVLPPRHGITGFVKPGVQDAEGRPVLLGNRDRRVKAIWDIAGDAGLRSCVVGYWMTFPAENIRGVMVAQTGAPPGENPDRARKGALRPGLSGQVHPADLEARVFALAAEAHQHLADDEREVFGDTREWPPPMQRLAAHSRWSLAADSAYERIALDLAAEPGRCDVVIVYLGLADVLGHRFWRWTWPGDFASPPSGDEVARFGDVLRRAYARIDAFVGRMRAAAGDGATVVVASDHGMGAFRPRNAVDLSKDDGDVPRTGAHSSVREAFFAAAGPGIAARPAGATPKLPADLAAVPQGGSIVDVAPTLLALLGIPRARDMDGHTMASVVAPDFAALASRREVETFTPAGWEETRIFAAGDDAAGDQRLEQLRGLGYIE